VAAFCSPLFEIARVLVRFDHVAHTGWSKLFQFEVESAITENKPRQVW